MKILLLFVCVNVCLFDLLHAAAVDTVVKATDKPAQDAATENALSIHIDCYQPKEIGRCFALFYRYAYNVESRKCEEFIFGGCAGNQNNFETKEDCERKCFKAVAEEDAAAVQPEVTTTGIEEVEGAITTAKTVPQPRD